MKPARTSTLLLGLAALAARAGAQPSVPPGPDDGPVVVGTPRESWKNFELMKLEAALELRWQYRNDTRTQAGQPDQTSTESRFRELFDLSGEASIGHRNLLDVTGSLQLGREDIFSDSSDPAAFTGHESDFVTLYDLSAIVFGSSRLPTNVYARRTQSLLDRPFAGSIDETLTEAGLGVRYQSERVAANLEYFHREDRLSGDFGAIDTSVRQDSLSLQGNFTLSASQRLETGYTFDRIDENQAGGYADAYDRHDVSLVHTAVFGKEAKPHELRSSLRYYAQGGRQEQDHLRWDELLTLRHSDRLESRYTFAADSLNVRDDSQNMLRGDASVRYRLFDSLTSVGTIGAQHLSTPGNFSSDDVLASGQLDYTKKVPFGRLDAAAGLSFDAQQNGERGSTIRVLNESFTFHDGFPIVISRRNIVPGSLTITPEASSLPYQENVDYTVTFSAGFAEVRSILGGGFVDGQALRISYDLGPEPSSEIDTAGTSFSIRYSITEGALKGLALYTTYRTVGHTVRADDPSLFRLDDSKDLLLGAEYRYAELDLLYEYNVHDSEFDPYTVHRFQALYSLPLGIGSAINAEWTHEIISYTDLGDDVTFDRGSLRWTKRLSGELDLNAGVDYRNEDSSRTGETQGFDQILGVTWHRRQTTLYASFRNSVVDSATSEESSQFFQIGFRRTF